MKFRHIVSTVAVAVLAFAMPFTAGATVKKEGNWPAEDRKIDLEFKGKPTDGLKKLAKEAEWSLVVANGVRIDENGADVNIDVDDEPADAVLEALFVGRDVVAYRNGKLVTVTPSSLVPATPAPPTLPAPPALPALPDAPPVPTVRGEDRTVLGDSSVIGKSEIVHTVTVAGGSLKVEGIVTGDLVVAGGSAKLVSGARVVGNVVVFGGSLKVEDKARIDGDVAINGGSLKREDGAIIGGSVVNDHDHDRSHRQHGRRGSGVKVDLDDKAKDASGEASDDASEHHSRIAEAAQSFGSSMSKMALLFVLGCVLLALLAPRMERLRVEIAARPMRAFATGLVGTVLGLLSSAILLTVLCVSVIGIPVAVMAVLLAVLAVYGAIASALTTFGAAVIGHKTQNPYLHLLLGCGAFLVLLSIPVVGGIVAFAVTMIAIGALILTRVGGLLDRRKKGWSDRPAAMR
jgi:hypothetical protein